MKPSIKKTLKLLKPGDFYSNFKRFVLQYNFRKKHFKIGLRSNIKNVNLGCFVFINENVSVKNSLIDNHTYIASNCRISDVKIGKFCSIGSNVSISLGFHPTDLVSTHPAFYSNNKQFITYPSKNYFDETLPVTIGNDVWIGNNVIIIGGVKVGNGAILAAGAVVTKDVKPYEIVGGVPAKHIKFRFEKLIISKISKTEWWNKPEEWLKTNYKLLHDPKKLIEYFEQNL